MLIKNKKMEFTNNQEKQLHQMKDLSKLQQLQTKCESLKEELETLINRRSQSLDEREMLIEYIKSLEEEIKKAKEEEFNRQRRLEEANKSFLNNNNDNIQSICLVLGYQISKYQVLENNTLQMTLCYRDSCCVTYSETRQIFDLIKIYPKHYNFEQIKDFLRSSQDLRGLLRCLRNFFDLALESKDKQENIQ